jgi:hypothetical protein
MVKAKSEEKVSDLNLFRGTEYEAQDLASSPS